MKGKYILSILALCMLPASLAGECENFDFGWKFKYMGDAVPAESASLCKASASEAGHGPSLAVDGNSATRWTAPNGKTGHSIEVNLGGAKKLSSIIVHWEKANNFEIQVTLGTKQRKVSRKIKQNNAETTMIPLKNTSVRSIKLTVTKGTSPSCWASIREIEFRDSKDKPLDLTQLKPAQKSGCLAGDPIQR